MKIKIGIAGCGGFASQFVPLFRDHPLVEKVAVCDMIRERADSYSKLYGIKDAYYSYEDLLKSDVNCIAVYSQRHLHGPMVIAALDAGKHVCSAVPTASSMDEIHQIVQKVRQTGLTYALMETSYYYGSTIFCRKKFKDGSMGKFVYGEARYCHDMDHFYASFRRSGGENWKQVAGIPPMYYPTHSVSMITSVTGAKVRKVSCSGFVDHHEDAIFREGANLWDNIFSNQSALMYTSDGGSCLINEFRRIGYSQGKNSVYQSLFGTEGVYEQGAAGCIWMEREKKITQDVTEFLNCCDASGGDLNFIDSGLSESLKLDFVTREGQVHNRARLPESFAKHRNGHFGSHQFLVDDFIKAVHFDKLPPNHVWAAAGYCAPGLVAHESAKKDGMLMDVPDFGDPPAGKAFLNPDEGHEWF